MTRIAFVGGGTGGHLTPAIGIAEELIARGHQVEFWLSGREVEQNYVKSGFVQRSLKIDYSKLPKKLAVLVAATRVQKYRWRFKPDVVVSLGGYGGAAAIAAWPRPIICLEGNVVAGKSVRYLSRIAAATLVMFSETATEVPRAKVVGPISRLASQISCREQAAAKFGLDPSRPILLTMGGSQGAVALNQSIIDLMPQLQSSGWQLLALTGAGKSEAMAVAAHECSINSCILEHCDDVGAAYSCADLMVSRGGASTLAEVWLNEIPTFVMPYHHADRQQQLNAEQLAPGVKIFDGSCEAKQMLMSAVDSPEIRTRMRDALKKMLVTDGKGIACDSIEEIAAARQ
ncbi:MAG: UDP-N-acetylglucosamine--N-acetylmuramyl-(pentapeptide) pyrophosphoryl-undecaprenol N-acetylglucosamine transferase [Planctomycetota bacterium]|nr:UDP-N-acetylglucosamine--N-acetylmuramyl-(pentapeptide) pyrophosphoryl-undecaprenol N-acetylglucosamine transferase [Planctomycetota bacterium]